MSKKHYIIPLIFVVSLLISVLILILINVRLSKCSSISFPTNLDELKMLCEKLSICYDDHKIEIHIFHMVCFIFLQTWCIPGTILFNLFGGAIFGVYLGTFICLLFNSLGALAAYLISKYFLTDALDSYKILSETKLKLTTLIENNKGNLIYYIIFLRLFPGSPNWLMNLTLPHVNVSPSKFFISVFIGIAPWNFFSCSAGAILRELTNTKEIMNKEKYFLLIGLALCFLIIPFLKNYYEKQKRLKLKNKLI